MRMSSPSENWACAAVGITIAKAGAASASAAIARADRNLDDVVLAMVFQPLFVDQSG